MISLINLPFEVCDFLRGLTLMAMLDGKCALPIARRHAAYFVSAAKADLGRYW